MQIPGSTPENLIQNSQLETAAPLHGVQPAELGFLRLDYYIPGQLHSLSSSYIHSTVRLTIDLYAQKNTASCVIIFS